MPTPDGLTVEPVRTRADLRDFLRVPPWGTRRETHGVPLWHSTVRSWWTGDGPHRQHGAVELFLVRDPWGGVHGRTTLHTDARMDATLGERALLLGATEFAGEPALAAMVEYAERRARELGRGRLLGPVSLLPNQVGGVLTSGWDEPGFLDGPWTPAHYPRDWEALGFERIWPGSTWICTGLAELEPEELFGGADLPEGYELHHARRSELDQQLPLLRQMLNASFAELDYFTRIEADELAAATDGLAHLLDERLLLWIERQGEPVAFVLAVPDLTGFVRRTRGRLAPLDAARLLLTRARYRREAVLIIKGTVPGARGQGLMRALSGELLRGLQLGGYRTLRVTFIEDDNAGSQAQFLAMGGRPLQGTCFYTRAVEPRATGPEPGSPAARLLARSADWGRAPSAHNTQPWDVSAVDGTTLRLGWHAERELPVADPTRRDLLLSLGALALSLRVVAAELDLVAEVDWAVDLPAREAARVRLVERGSSGAEGSPWTVAEEAPGQASGPEGSPWTVPELRSRATVRAPYPQRPTSVEVAEIAALAGLPADGGLLVLPDDLVDGLLPAASAYALTGPGATELAGWLRLSPRHPRHDQDGLSAAAMGLGSAEAAGLGWLTGSAAARRLLATTRLDRLVARGSAARPRGTVVALFSTPDLPLADVGALGEGLLASWLAGERAGWSAHPLSELLDEPGSAAALQAHVTRALGRPAQVYAVWRCGRAAGASGRASGTGDAEAYRSPRLTD